MRKRRGSGGGHETAGSGAERWLLTYADMITLLLALFIVLFSMSTIDIIKFDAFKHALSAEFHGQVIEAPGKVTPGSKSVLDADNTRNVKPTPTPFTVFPETQTPVARDLQRIKGDVTDLVKKQQLDNKVGVKFTERGIVINLAGDAFFASGSAALNPKMEKIVKKIAVSLRDEKREIRVEGHTDGQPIATAQFPSNWELSGARANTILRYLLGQGVSSKKIGFTGYADERWVIKPDYPAQSIAKNRRVEIVILAPGANAKEAIEGSNAQARANGEPAGQPIVSGTPQVIDVIIPFSMG